MDLSRLSTSELTKIAGGDMKGLSTETLKMIAGSKPEVSIGHEALAVPHGLAKGVAQTVDLVNTLNPARAIRESLTGRHTRSVESLLPEYEPKTAPGRIRPDDVWHSKL